MPAVRFVSRPGYGRRKRERRRNYRWTSAGTRRTQGSQRPFRLGTERPSLGCRRRRRLRRRRRRNSGLFHALPPLSPAGFFRFSLAARRQRLRRPLLSFGFGHDRCRLLLGIRENLVVFFCIFYEIRNVQKSIFFQTDAYERRLHPRQHLGYFALVDVSQNAPSSVALDVKLGQLVVFQNSDFRFQGRTGNDHFLDHQ